MEGFVVDLNLSWVLVAVLSLVAAYFGIRFTYRTYTAALTYVRQNYLQEHIVAFVMIATGLVTAVMGCVSVFGQCRDAANIRELQTLVLHSYRYDSSRSRPSDEFVANESVIARRLEFLREAQSKYDTHPPIAVYAAIMMLGVLVTIWGLNYVTEIPKDVHQRYERYRKYVAIAAKYRADRAQTDEDRSPPKKDPAAKID